MITIVVLVVSTIYLLYRLAHRNLNYWKDLGVPCMKDSLPVFGDTFGILRKKTTVNEFKLDAYRYFKNEKFGGYLMNQTPVFLPMDPKLVYAIFVKDFEYFHDRTYPKVTSDILDKAIFHLTGDKWKNIRYKLTPLFTSSKLKMMFDSIKENSEEVATYLKTNSVLEAKEMTFKFVLNVSGDVAFGIKVNALQEPTGLGKSFIDATNSFFMPSGKRLFNFIIRSSFPKFANLIKLNLMDNEVSKFFITLSKDMIRQRQLTGVKRNDFLQLMLDARKESSKSNNISVEEPEDMELLKQMKTIDKEGNSHTEVLFDDDTIAAQSFLFIAAGSETVAVVLSFALYELAANVDIQERLRQEINDKVNALGFTYEAMKSITYLDQVLYEVMRMYPASGGLFRICTKDYRIPETNITIEKGTTVTMPLYGIHMDSRYFPNPEKFNPDRFSDMNAVPKNVFYPFGAGPRMCIAMRLAMLEMKIFMATILSRYNVILHEKTQLPLKMDLKSVTSKALGGIWVKFEERN